VKVERDKLLALIKEAEEPIPGAVLAARLGVSRQAVVHHIAVLRAAGLPIEATIRGYVWRAHQGLRDVFMVRHRPEETADELFALVDAGLTVVDVLVEHPLYGELRGGLDLHSRSDVQQFLDALALTGGTLLSTLTDGVHWHTVEARDEAAIARGRKALERLGFWLDHSPSKSPTPR
jgi:transcriptional regulator of NAD metabolism